MPDRRCRTGKVLPAIAKVFGSDELHAMPICQGGADSVGASGGFTPISARNKVDARQATANGGIPNDIEQAALFASIELPPFRFCQPDRISAARQANRPHAGVAAFLSVAYLMRYFRVGRLDPFAYYCAAFGVVSLILLSR